MATELETAFGIGLIDESIKGKLDIDYLLDIPNRSVAQQAYDFIRNQSNDLELRKRHSEPEMRRIWKCVLRSCISHGVPLSNRHLLYAKSLGVVLPG